MSKMKKRYIWGVIILVFLGMFAYRISDKFFKPKPMVAEQGAPVEVQTVKPGSIQNILLLTGNAEPEETVTLSSKRSNLILEIYAKENQRISQGQLLIKLDAQDLNAQVAQSNAQVIASQANAAQVKAQLDNALNDLQRMQSLFVQGAISQQQLDSAQTQYNTLKAQYNATLAQANATRSNVSYYAALAGDTNLKAPFNGVVISKMAEAGEVVDGGKSILVVGKVDRMKIKANVSEMDISKIQPGQQVKVLVDALPGEEFVGKIKQILPQVDLQSRSLVAEILIENPNFKIKPNMFARSLIVTEKQENTIVIPKPAIIYKNDKPYVYLAVDNKSKLVPVTIGITQGETVQITGGLQAGDKIITAGQNVIDDNVSLDIRKVGE